jgi:uncharacterized DUF497 family protein
VSQENKQTLVAYRLMDALGRVLVVVFTGRGEDVRIIPARKATHNQRKQYEG